MLVIGAPVCGRGWILQEWFDRLADQDGFDSKEIGVIFHVGPSKDDTEKIIFREQVSERWAFVETMSDDSDGHLDRGRTWNYTRYEHMARMRNDLLALAIRKGADHYLSCDTDMLLPHDTLRVLFQDLGENDGIAPLTFMTPRGTGEQITNAMLDNGNRYVVGNEVYRVYACFGVVLMKRGLMNIAYEAHGLGEDLGWAKNVRMAALRLAITPRARVKHVMQPEHLGLVDDRIGF